MQITTEGLILRVQSSGDRDKLCTILTAKNGVIRAFARGAASIKNKNASATGLFTFAKFSIYKSKDAYIIDEAEIKELFFDVRGDLEKLALSQYFCSLAIALCREQAEDGESLRLLLNSLAFLTKAKLPDLQIKAIFELRMMELHGYMPDLIMCQKCGCYEAGELLFLPKRGVFYCSECAADIYEAAVRLPTGVLFAMRHIIYVDFGKIFSFKLAEKQLKILAEVCERYVLAQTEQSFATLEFYKGLLG
ncbi:MAG: DNA repair protein RecO [Oscillospiraceae bacterium]|jgi:DNA repair protein RecO (recombination protein O)|nr:DNA repair protein RecO [Oscillospiraceae bacterium]